MSAAKQQVRPMTADELWELPEKPGVRFELAEGELVEVPGAGGLHAQFVTTLLLLLHAFVVERKLGVVFGDGLGYVLSRNPDVVRIPDVSFIAGARIREGGVPEGYIPFAPDLAVEIVSPNDRAEDVHDKVREYQSAGAKLVWVLWPKRRSLTVHTADGRARDLGPDDALDGGEVLPGFSVRVVELFAVGE